MKSPSLWKTIVHEMLSLSTFLWVLFLAVIYLFTIQLLLNYQLLIGGIIDHFSFITMLRLMLSLFVGSFTSLSAEAFPFAVLLLNALFVGINLVLLIKTLGSMQRIGKVHISLGGAAFFSLVTAGCASCGLSLLSVFGLSATLAFLPFHGAELRIISLGLLMLSAFYMLLKLHDAKYCRI